MSTTPTSGPPATSSAVERADLLESLGRHRYLLRVTVEGITDEQARQRSTASELTLAGLIKHVADTEESWVDFMLGLPDAMGGADAWTDAGEAAEPVEWEDTRFRVESNETLAGLLARYEEVARRTDELVATVDLDASHPLPKAPWFEADARWSARRVLLHIVAETAQHAGHADIIRESIDGAKTMG